MGNKRCFCKQLMFSLFRMTARVFNRVLRITLQELAYTIFFTLIIVFFLLYVYNSNRKTDDGYESSDNPVILWWTEGFPGTAETRSCPGDIKCDVYCDRNVKNVRAYLFYGSNIKTSDLPKRSKGVIWGLYHEESPRNVEELMHEQMLNLFNFSATFSRFSDVPFPLQYINSLEDITSTEYFVGTSEKNSYLKEISPIMYLQSDCETSTERDAYVKELMKLIHVDSYGLCLKNKDMPARFTEDYLNNLDDAEFLKFIARYKFVVAIENGVCDDYVTEKFWRAIKIGTVPIYFGSPSVTNWFPNNKSAILIKDFPTPERLLEHINILLKNDTLYEDYLEHKTKQVVTNQRLIDELQARPYQTNALESAEIFECLICKKLHEKHAKISIVNKSHYDCPKPISALTLNVNPQNDWLFSWESAKKRVKEIFRKVVALVLIVLPHVVEPVDLMFCMIAGPTLMLSIYMMVLYLVDQVLYEAEFYYVLLELIFLTLGLMSLAIIGKLSGAIYGLFYIDLMIAFSMDLYYQHKERGFPI